MQLLCAATHLAKNPYVMYPLSIAGGSALSRCLKEIGKHAPFSLRLPSVFHRLITVALPDNALVITLCLSHNIDKIPFLSPIGGKTQFYAKVATTVLVSSLFCDIARKCGRIPLEFVCKKTQDFYIGPAIRFCANYFIASDGKSIARMPDRETIK
jgi:hypothetical protein